MREGTVVQTEYGRGVIVGREDTSRYLVLLDDPKKLNDNLKQMHQGQRGLYFWKNELTPVLEDK